MGSQQVKKLSSKSLLKGKVQIDNAVKRQQRCHLRFTMVKGSQGERVRLYVRGTILGYKRSKSNQYPNTSLIQIEGVNTKEEVGWYCGKRMAYIYKAKVKKNGSHYRCIWGKVTRPHGNSGVVRAKFKSNLPPKSMLYALFLVCDDGNTIEISLGFSVINLVTMLGRNCKLVG
ncbi:hypothetical protein CXB51_002568 [Gossypium anomalum]|uniref:Ribosomal protein L35A n=1 Tax=Gossypium anomalum TaxID=47600 RepID=A0A8J5ZMK1_9ROSI|nr:hypothetical protein CXB51_002568 [Gossypium anomalum]